jgi:ferredoxin-thioredoxin reductase catalytic subunit
MSRPTTWVQRAVATHLAANCPEGFEVNLAALPAITRRLILADGQCPCAHPEWNESTPADMKECPCHTFRQERHCHCGLYVPRRK